MPERIPALVLALADKVKLTPLAWREDADGVTIVFEQGAKLRFERESPKKLPDRDRQTTTE
jgi:hypothetical protein